MKQNYALVVARLENQAASAPYSRSSVPRPGLKSGWNLEAPPEVLRGETAGLSSDLSAASEARLLRLATLALGTRKQVALAPQALPACDEKVTKLMLSFSPPRFKVMKAGPRAGQTVELKFKVEFVSRTVTDAAGTVYSFTSRSASARVSTSPKPLTPQALRATFLRRWPAAATELADFLLLADLTE